MAIICHAVLIAVLLTSIGETIAVAIWIALVRNAVAVTVIAVQLTTIRDAVAVAVLAGLAHIRRTVGIAVGEVLAVV
ncbi:MAG: hypothetical protein VYE42_04240, partial [Actinomycetota bacterium]|nr:hypothetical protein [Actinomycetota bacterium]